MVSLVACLPNARQLSRFATLQKRLTGYEEVQRKGELKSHEEVRVCVVCAKHIALAAVLSRLTS